MEKTDVELVLEAYDRLPRKAIMQERSGFMDMTRAKDEILDILLRPRVKKEIRQAILGMVQAELYAREVSHAAHDAMNSPLMEKEHQIDRAVQEASDALSVPAQGTTAECLEAFRLWVADLKGGALENLDALIERDKGTAREAMWREFRAGYEKELAEGKCDGKA